MLLSDDPLLQGTARAGDLDAIFEAIDEAIVQIDADWRVLYANDGYLRFARMTRAEDGRPAGPRRGLTVMMRVVPSRRAPAADPMTISMVLRLVTRSRPAFDCDMRTTPSTATVAASPKMSLAPGSTPRALISNSWSIA